MSSSAIAEIAAGLLTARVSAGLDAAGARPLPVPPLPRCGACGGRGLLIRLTPLPVSAGGRWGAEACGDCRAGSHPEILLPAS